MNDLAELKDLKTNIKILVKKFEDTIGLHVKNIYVMRNDPHAINNPDSLVSINIFLKEKIYKFNGL